jgi:hypothetical protein
MFHFVRELKCVESLLDTLSPLFVPIFYSVNKTALSGACATKVWTNNLQMNSLVTNTNLKYFVPQKLL